MKQAGNTAETSVVVRVRGLTRRFGELTAVDSLNLEIRSGEIFGLVGPDGAGKTTTMRLLCGLMDPSDGSVEVCGLDVAREPARVRDRIGYMAQRFGLYVDLTVKENLDFYAELFSLRDEKRADLMEQLLSMTRMAPFRDRQAGKLSGGMKQKLALMCALLHEPEVLFLDEPTNGVDPISRRDFWVILYQLVRRGLTVVVSTAYLDEAERCNRVGLMHEGRLILCDAPDALGGHVRGRCFRLHCDDVRGCRRVLEDWPPAQSVRPSGASVRVMLEPEVTVSELNRFLESRGYGKVSIEPVPTSVEDVFITLTAERAV
ncbi:MAG: ABC transporter ATP-binding protein [Acidobacteriota bacterium]